MSHITDKQYVDADRRVQLYRRTDSKAAYWHAKFRIKGQKKYKRVSTGTTDFDDAKRWAIKEFMRTELRVNEFGEALTSYSFKEMATKWLEDRKTALGREEIAKGTYGRDEGTVNRYLIPFFGKMRIGNVTQTDLDEFREWRENYWITGDGKDKRHKKKKLPNTNSIRQENIPLRLIFKRACELGQMRSDTFRAFVWRGQSIGNNRREHFDEADWKQMTDYMRRNDWLKHSHTRVARDRTMLRDYVLILKNTGMRVGEARHLKWRDVQWRKDKRVGEYLVCSVDGKRGERAVVCNAGTDKYFERVKAASNHTEPNDWVWAKADGTLHADFSVGFKKLLKTVFGEEEQRTLYSLRHTFATEKILKDNVNLKMLAERMGTSVNMLDKHYGHVNEEEAGKHEAAKAERYKKIAEEKERREKGVI
jgi:integrase